MSLFEDLIDELKEDNLLEETVIDTVKPTELEFTANNKADQEVKVEIEPLIKNEQTDNNIIRQNDLSAGVTSDLMTDSVEVNSAPEKTINPPIVVQTETENKPHKEVSALENETVKEAQQNEMLGQELAKPTEEKTEVLKEEFKIEKEEIPTAEIKTEQVQAKLNEAEIIKENVTDSAKENVARVVSNLTTNSGEENDFYRRRALDEVNGLEMVDHVLTGVEREMMKVLPKSYDNYGVKQSLHEFLQVANQVDSPKHAELEFALMKETEKWYSALNERDKDVSVSNLRRYCETTKPSLSSQALVSLARFYRNAPYSEPTRSKFDLVITKLFSKDIEQGKRDLLFKAGELINHIKDLYADWSSTPLYSTDDDDSELLLAALKFQDFIAEANNAESFDELVLKDFFKRLKIFKEKTNENFFAPIVVAAAIECNVAVGNLYIDLLYKVRDEEQNGSLTEKYGNIHDKSISEATSKTFELLEIIKEKKAIDATSINSVASKTQSYQPSKPKSTYDERRRKFLFGANKWLIAATVLTLILATVYFTTNLGEKIGVGNLPISKDVKIVNLQNSSLKEYVESARISKETMFAITNDSWSKRDFSEKKGVVEKFLTTGKEKGFKKVHLLNAEGETVAFGSKDGVEIVK